MPVIGDYLRGLDLEKPHEVIVREQKSKRSLEQNDRLWAIYKIIGDELGYTKDEIHSLMRFKFLSPVIRHVNGETIEELPSTTKLKVGEMCEYQESIDRWAGEMGIIIFWRADD